MREDTRKENVPKKTGAGRKGPWWCLVPFSLLWAFFWGPLPALFR